MKKKIIFTLCLVVLFIISLFTYKHYFDNEDVNIIIDNKNHKSESIDEVIELTKKTFHDEGFKASLLSIEYNEDLVSSLEEELKVEYNAEEAIIIKMKFKTYLITNQVFNSNNEYSYDLYFVRNENSWKLANMGQG